MTEARRKALAEALADEIEFDIVLWEIARRFGFTPQELAEASERAEPLSRPASDSLVAVIGKAVSAIAAASSAPLLVFEKLTDALVAISKPRRRIAIRNAKGDIVEMRDVEV